nr:cell division inhibitor protein [Enterobacter hormaechei]
MFRQPGDKGKQEGIIMVHQHYGPQTVNRGAVMPGMLVKHKDSTWTASANARGRLYLHRGVERTYTKDLLVEVYLNGVGNGLSH